MFTTTDAPGAPWKLITSLALTLLLLTSSAWAQEQSDSPVRTIQPERFDVLPALRDVQPGQVAPSKRGQYEVPNKMLPQRFEEKRALGQDPARQSLMGQQFANAPLSNFDGLGNTDNEAVIGGRVAPPDPELDVGEDYIVEMVNLLLAVYDKQTGELVYGPVENNAVFDGFGGDCEFDNTGDVISLYDEEADRWLVSHMSFGGDNPGTECVAISQTSDPTGAWYRYEFVISETANNDYPKLGVGSDAYYSFYNMFEGGFVGGIAAAFDRDAMIAGDPNATAILFGPNTSQFSLMPADVDGAMPSPSPGGIFAGFTQDEVQVYQFNADFDTPSNSTFELVAELATEPFDTQLCSAPRGACIPQPDGPDLESLAGRFMQRLQYRDMGDYQTMVINHTVDADGQGTAGVRWYEIRDQNEDGTWSIYQQGTYAPDDGENRFMGSIAMDANGNIGLAYSVSSETTNPAIRYTGRPAGAPLGQMVFEEQSIIEGPTSQQGTARWGDYSALDVDPSNGSTFWYAGEYADDITGTLNWDTRIASFAFDPDDETPPTAISDLAASPVANTAELTWTAPADDAGDAGSGSVVGYDIRYSADGPIDDSNFEDATPAGGAPNPGDPGDPQSFTVTGLDFSTEYWFAVRASDDNGNTSLSNSPSTTTEVAPLLSFTPTELTQALEPNQTAEQTITVTNDGPAGSTLEFRFPGFASQNLLSQPGIQKNDVSPVGVNTNHAKGDDNLSGVGNPILLGAGGPDAYGYEWIDSNEPGGPAFSWVDISGDGTEVSLSDDDGTTVPLPFTFEFYGEPKTEISISSNGYLTFGSDASSLGNSELPNPESPNDLIAMYWDDLDPGDSQGGGGSIYYYYDETNDRFIVQYEAVPHFPDGNGETSTFQAILNADGSIKLQYLDMTDDEGTPNSHTIGIENADGSDGLQVAFNTPYMENELAIEIAATPDFIANVEPASGTLGSGESQDATVTFNSDSIEPGTYEDDLALASNDPSSLNNVIPATLTVSAGPPAIALNPDSLGFGEVLVGGNATQSFTIVNVGGGPLSISTIASDNSAFTVGEAGPVTVPFDDSLTIDVVYSPTEVGTDSGLITVESDDPDTPSATVEVTGEGIPAPVIAVTPDELFQELVIGETAEQTLTLSNEGESDLAFNATFDPSTAPDGASVDRSEVTPSVTTTGGGADASAFAASGAPSAANPAPYAPEDAIYQLDDGSTENAIGLTDGGDVMWINAFQVVEGAGAITEISSVWGSTGGMGQPPEGAPARFFVYEDPNDDGDPSDAVLLTEVATTVQDPGTDTFTTEAIAPTRVEGTFFIAALFQNQEPDTFPAPLDQSSGSQGASWIVGNTVQGGFNVDDLAANDLAPALTDDVGLPGNWVLRADGGATFVTVSPASGTVAPGESLEITATFDASGLDVDTYTGDVVFASNDPETPELGIPTTLEVTSAPYPFALSPASHSATIDVNEDPDEVETRQVTIENTTDSEQSFTIEAVGAEGNAPSMGGPVTRDALQRIDQALIQYARQQAAPRDASTMLGPDPNRGAYEMPEKLRGLIDRLAPVGVSAYGPSISFNGAFEGQFVSFDLGEPSQLQGFAPLPASTLFAGDFLLGDEDTFYAINNDSRAFLAVDVATGETNQVGTSTPSSSDETWTEMATDPTDGTVYASTGTNLYTLDPETGEATLVGPFNTPEGETMIAIAVDTDGNIYGHGIDLSDAPDKLFSIDPETGAASLIGSTGVDAFFAQGMDFDPDTGQLYMAWYQGGGVGGLRTVDPETGASELVGPFQGDEIGFMAVPSAGFIFIDNDLQAGTLAPGGSITLDVTVDASGLIAGTYDANFNVIADVPGNPVDFVPFTLEVIADPLAAIAPDTLEFADTFVNDTTRQEVVFTNPGRDVLEVSEVTLPANFSLASPVPSTLEPGESVAFDVLFTPTAVQDYAGTLSIVSNAPNSPSTVDLSGAGTEAPVASWSPEAFDVQAYPGQQYERTLTVSNTGGNPLTYSISENVTDFPMPEPNAIFELKLLDEDFEEGSLPDGWDRTSNGVGWEVGDALGSFFFPIPSNTIYAASNDDAAGPGNDGSEDYLITPSLDFTNFPGGVVEFDSYYNGNFSQLAFVEVSTDGGATFEVVEQIDPADEWIRRSVDLSAYAGESDVRIAFHADDDGAFASGWAVDDVQVKRSLEFLTISTTQDTIEAGGSQDLTLSLDATDLPGGTYQVDYTFSTNDPLNQTQTIPFTINVIESLSVTPEPEVGDDEVVHPNEEFSVPLVVESLDDLGVEAYEFTLNFDGDKLEALGVETAGTLSDGLALATNISEGEVQVAASDNEDTSAPDPILFSIEGEGTLIILNMRAKEALGTSDLILSELLFNEGQPPATANDASVEITPLYGDVTLNLEVSAFDAAEALQYAVEATELSDVAVTSGDVTGNGELSAFDAAFILDFVVSKIDCFPAVEDCGDDATPALALKKESRATPHAELRWGKVTEAMAQQSDASKSDAEREGQAFALPLTLREASGSVRALQVTTQVDPQKATIDAVKANLPDDWQMAHWVMDDGTVHIAMAGQTPISGGRDLASLQMRWLQEEAQIEMGGQAIVNEAQAQAMEMASITPIPEKFALKGNYPNPFGQVTEIALDLPSAGNVRVEVYDVLGRRVLVAQDGEMPAGTNQSVQIDGSRLASGLYIYRVIADIDGERQVETGRMTLVR